MSGKDLKVVEKTTKDLLNLSGLSDAKFKVGETKEYISVEITTETSSPLIGHRGENLSALQLIIRLIVYQKLDKWLKVILNVNDWREKREEYLQQMASNFAQKVKFSGQEVQLPLLSSAERRVVHMYLADHPDVVTVSEGEGSQRRLVIKPKD